MNAISPWPVLRRAAFGFLCLYLAIGLCLHLAGVPNRVALVSGLSLLVTALPFFGLYLLFPRLERAGNIVYGLWAMLFTLDNLARGYSMARYGVDSDSNAVIEALANASMREFVEYVVDGLPVLMALAIILPVAAWLISRPMAAVGQLAAARVPPLRVGSVIAGCLLILLPLIAHSNPVVRRANPVTRWGEIVDRYIGQEQSRQELIATRAAARAKLPQWQPRLTASAPSTFVLVIGESSNRWDWSLYGYPRKTTPKLDAMADQLVVFTDTVSSYGSTLTEMIRMLTPSEIDNGEAWRSEPDVMSLAKAAGYKTFWLTNQNDFFINTVFGSQADVFELINRGLGQRDDTSLDEGLMPHLDRALADPAPHKLIILHTLGSHQNYELRYPEAFARFNDVEDAVTADMADKWVWVRQTRGLYDNSILYTDFVLAEVIGRLKKAEQSQSMMLFVSDHAQDVGHLTGAWGHQFKLESGFTVPMVLWAKNRPDLVANRLAIGARPYQTDKLDFTLLDLMGVATSKDRPDQVVTGPDYKPWPRVIDGRPYVPGKSHITLPDS